MAEDLIRMEHINKFFGRVQALDDVNLKVSRQEIVGLLGDNGAGKSTLIKVLSGALRATSGEIYVRGKNSKCAARRTPSPRASRRSIRIWRWLRNCRSRAICSSAANRSRDRTSSTRWTPRGWSRSPANSSGEWESASSFPASTPIGSLSGGERQAVAIARAMYFDSDLIILDEPTNNLGVAETQGVLRFVRNARDSGHSCIFIAHNIHHVFQVVDRIVVMRRGRSSPTISTRRTTSVAEVEQVITGDLTGATH